MLIPAASFCIDIGERLGLDEARAMGAWFPGLTIEALKGAEPRFRAVGIIFGPARLCTIEGGYGHAEYRPPRSLTSRTPTIRVLVSLGQKFEITQAGTRRTIPAGGVCITDDAQGHSAWCTPGKVITLQLPRERVMSRHPKFSRLGLPAMEPDDPGTILLRTSLASVAENAQRVDPDQHSDLVDALVGLLGPPRVQGEAVEWRVQKAVSFISGNLGEPSLVPETVARQQSISRRSLDALFVRVLGRTIAQEILEQRLLHASAHIANPSSRIRNIGELAFLVGFEHQAHFTRAFVRRFGMTPSAWRQASGESHAYHA